MSLSDFIWINNGSWQINGVNQYDHQALMNLMTFAYKIRDKFLKNYFKNFFENFQ